MKNKKQRAIIKSHVQVLNLMGIASYILGIRLGFEHLLQEVARKAMSFGEEFHQIPKISSIQEIIANDAMETK